MTSKIFEYSRDLMISAKERFLGEDYWIPKSADEIVEIPKNQLGSHQNVTDDFPFAILGATYGESKLPTYHVVLSWSKEVTKKEYEEMNKLNPDLSLRCPETEPTRESVKPDLSESVKPENSESTAIQNGTTNDIENKGEVPETKAPLGAEFSDTAFAVLRNFSDKKLSIFRSNEYDTAAEVYQSCLRCKILFDSQDNLKDLRQLVSKIRSHPLWQEVHIACRLDYRWYFSKIAKDVKVINVLRIASTPEGWHPLSLAIRYGHNDLVQTLAQLGADPVVCEMSGSNALHIAAEFGNAQIVDILCATPYKSSILNGHNKEGSTPLFVAVSKANPFIVTALLRQGAEFSVKCKGRTPLYEAMQQKSGKTSEVVQLLVDQSPLVLQERDEFTGNTALHCAAGKHALSSILLVGSKLGDKFDINTKNKAGRTALHIFTHRGDLGSVVTLAAYNADVHVQDDHGVTPLHTACSRADGDIVKLLLVLGANVDAVTTAGDSPRHMAARLNNKAKKDIVDYLNTCGAKRCPVDRVGCASGCVEMSSKSPSSKTAIRMQSCASFTNSLDVPEIEELTPECNLESCEEVDEFMQSECIQSVLRLAGQPRTRVKSPNSGESLRNESPSRSPMRDVDQKKQLVTLLSLDGGGIKGLILIQILGGVQTYLPHPVQDYFDWIGGTSTGSFVAAALSLGKTLPACQAIYLRLKDQLFDNWVRPYNTENLEAFIKQEVGGNYTLADLKHKVMIPTVRADIYPVQLHLFRSYRLPGLDSATNEKNGYSDPANTYLWRALRCSSAAPTFFSSVDGKFVDGGLVSNNPTMELLTEVHRWNATLRMNKKPLSSQLRVGCVLSVGCGSIPNQSVENLDFGNPYSAAVAMKNLGYILVDQVTQTEGSTVERARAWCHGADIPYFRMTTPLDKEIPMDMKDDKEIVNLMWLTLLYTKKKDKDLQQLADLLKKLKPHLANE